MKKFIKRSILVAGLMFTIGGVNASLTAPVHAAKVDAVATKQYQSDIKKYHKASQKLSGKNGKYATYTFKLSKTTNAYYLHWLNHKDEHQVIGKTVLPKGTIVYADRASSNGIEWDVKTDQANLTQGVSMAMVLTNQNAKPVAGNYYQVLEATVQHLN